MTEDRFMLKYEAVDAVHARGHVLGSGWMDTGNYSYAICSHCNMEVGININPLPNEIRISGESVAMNCPATRGRKFASASTQGFNLVCDDCSAIVHHYSSYFKCETDCKRLVCVDCQPKHKCITADEFVEHTHECKLCSNYYDCLCANASSNRAQGEALICVACVRNIAKLGRVYGEFSHTHDLSVNPPFPTTGVALSPIN